MDKKKIKLIFGFLLLAVIIGGAYILYGTLSSMQTPGNQGTKTPVAQRRAAPDFTVLDTEGKEVKLSDMKGKGVVVNFWASWCPPCKEELPDFEQMYKKYGDEIVFMIVNMTDGVQETEEKAAAHIMEKGYTFPVYYDSYLSAAMAYSVSSIPATYFIDAQGKIATSANGMINGELIKQGIEMIK